MSLPRIPNHDVTQRIKSYTMPWADYALEFKHDLSGQETQSFFGEKIQGHKAFKQWVMFVLMTQRLAYVYNPEWFGFDRGMFFGETYGFLRVHIEPELKRCLMVDPVVTRVRVTNIKKIDSSSSVVAFDVFANDYKLSMEHTVVYG